MPAIVWVKHRCGVGLRHKGMVLPNIPMCGQNRFPEVILCVYWIIEWVVTIMIFLVNWENNNFLSEIPCLEQHEYDLIEWCKCKTKPQVAKMDEW